MTMVAGFAIGLGWNMVNRGNNWKYAIGFGLAHPVTRGWIWRGAKWVAPIAWKGTKILASDTLVVARAATATRTAAAVGTGAMYVSAVAAGYTIGAVTTTAAVSELEKRDKVYSGATEDVLDFYLLKGGADSETSRDRSAWYESDKPVLNIPGDVAYIAGHYWKKWTQTILLQSL